MTHRPQPSNAPPEGQPPPRKAASRLPAEWRNAARFLRQKLRGNAGAARGGTLPIPRYVERATCVSFQMDGVPLGADEFRAALARGSAARSCRTRSAQRARNHVAILHRVEILLRRGQPLQTGDVIRWYTSIACGLSAGGLSDQALERIDGVVSAVNSPRLRFWPAVKEVAALHVKLLDDPFVPGFNGILARLLLRYHMGRCGLPPILFDPATDPPRLGAVSTLEPRLLELILASQNRDFTS
jgi:hypothetical protein